VGEGAPAISGRSAALFILSFRHRDELALAADRAGWRAIAARRAAGAERRFLQSGAEVVIVDARGALDDGLAAIRALADPVQANAAALLALVSRGDVARLGEIYEAGATHYLASPFGEAEFAHALRFAARHSDRLGGGAIGRALLSETETLGWRCAADGVTMSPALRDRLGIAADPISPRAALRLLDSGGRRALRLARRRLVQGVGSTAVTHRLPNGDRVVQHLATIEGGLTGFVEPLEPGEEPPLRTRRDPLTGLADGSAARRWIAEQLRRGGQPGLLLIGLARFDTLNAAYGRAAGDALLQAAARRIARVPTELGLARGFAARMAGTEFMVGLPGARIGQLRLVAEQILTALDRRFLAGADTVALATHIGGVCAGPDEEAAALLRRASGALAEARDADDPICLLDPEAARTVSGAKRLAAELRQGIAADEVEILFQPQVSIATGAIVGAEALARWRHPELGPIGAEPLFAAAARADHLVQLSAHVQDRALREAAAWPAALAALRLSINVTAEEMRHPSFAEALLARADRAGFPRARLTIEVTESGLIEDLSDAAALLSALRAGGCRVAIDDFGTGYSSLAYLKALPLDYLKIDKGLTQDIAGSPRDRVVVRGAIEMGRSLGLGVIAEGVETEPQLAALAEEGCTLYQGYLCSAPVAAAALADLVARQP
jgi:diguanylate cyclase (GGDEF)-like protein